MAESTGNVGQAVDDHLEVDSQATENDSIYGSELSGYTASLTSSVVNYRQENGRRYHGYRDGNYLLPNDEEEADRLDMIHHMMLAIMKDKLFLAPLNPGLQKAMDLGTGTGIWAIDFADQFPSAEVIGNDLSPTQPSLVPPNLRFIVEDFEDEWVYPSNHFDFIHGRFLAGSVKDYAGLIKQCYKHTAPGQWVEFQDWDPNPYSEDGSLKGAALEKYYDLVVEPFLKTGYVANAGPHLERWLREAGFKDICVQKHIVPIGSWPKDKYYKKIGTWTILQYESGGFEAGAMAVLTRHAGWTEQEVKILASQARSDMRNRRIHGMFDCYVVYGRKPE
ncbi:predicted protein [Uncinocarpus reesii 1704]|uniref:Methyltransferase n=1 Tax=Uncinocarpus reesii (strain UAMH 1704) TaxID=336963 RepID=C4JPN4_UNCRE|nr:uncharacterized protein UREG_03206 [Uncinocarpus reesii 1704]EEP78360.1 predicted protein [Uncinocarpus reesii 1704]